MEGLSGIQLIVTILISSGVTGGVLTLLTKKVWSPESKNELARIGNEFAQQLLEEARTERAELRTTIEKLENSELTKAETIERLHALARDKDAVIQLLEERQFVVARKVQLGQVVTYFDIFGPRTPAEFIETFEGRT